MSSGGASGSSQRDENKVKKVQAQADQVADMARQNITMTLDQLERLDDMEKKAEVLETSGQEFHRGAVKVRRKFCWETYRNVLIILLLLAIIGVVLYFVIKKVTN